MEYKKVSVIPTRVSIEFKKLEPKDFDRDYEVKNGRTTILIPDDNGYIETSLSEHINDDFILN